MPLDPKGLENFLEDAKQAYLKMMRRAGPASGDTMDDIEVQAEQAGGQLIRKLLAERLAAEEAAQSEAPTCPKCGYKMRRPPQANPRHLQTASGDVPYERKHAFCDRCGASFSPSGRPAQNPSTGRVQPTPAEGLRGQSGRVLSSGLSGAEKSGRSGDQPQAGPTHHRKGRKRPGRRT